MRKLLALVLLLVALACQPLPTPGPAGTTTTTSTSTTTTTRPSQTDLEARIRQNAVTTIDQTVNVTSLNLSGIRDRTINFGPNGKLRRTVTPTASTSQVIILNGASNVTINGLRIDGDTVTAAHPDGCVEQDPNLRSFGVDSQGVIYDPKIEHQHGIEISGSSNITLSGGLIQGLHGDGVYLAGGSSGIRINNLTARCVGRGALVSVGSQDVVVSNSYFGKAGFWSLNIEPDLQAEVRGFRVENSTFGYATGNWFFSGGPYYSCKVSGVRIVNPRVEPQIWGWYTKPCSPATDIQISGCTTTGSRPACLRQ